ncbi:hypothetical protein A1F94_007232 [Pyrenophora tritici-repentis]|uniref:DUF7730 domain-containing protein n=2 Tax=Pyrenophora tritici-repentis TaxID=45151 RepID=A0A2W1F569_9PLEO|nr:uncharacterized protein PTRG_08045 [Pyrenophora tritici-repentis Pt-1C-BFP]KAF7445864.1 hypothetical protein A1F99_091550 [Pyrenophora tritici-repentis]EDU50964.1 predicted protein [Pyrenophora tritici-repentis Pt-1C-BFP]KAG9381578.1 hypothetical protein A1F94_007232 [Pyrenophora tritici-repentis]KAI0577163.1 hypothetical protein Alg130_08495 [Pyrenophora tritici-repentis]KAI0577585.1 hypothetical protein Alg215_06831 [Pyrenophora tritici-repentis]
MKRTTLALTDEGFVDTGKLATCPIAARNRGSSPLLQLPGELRVMIFTFALQGPGLQIYTGSDGCLSADAAVLKARICRGKLNNSLRSGDGVFSYTTLSPVCRQIYDETCLLPYALNSFWFYSTDAMQAWISKRLPAQLRQVKEVKVPAYFESRYEFEQGYKFTSYFPMLKVLYIDLWRGRMCNEIIGWSKVQIDEDLQARRRSLLAKERAGLELVVTNYVATVFGRNVFIRAS